MTEDRCYRDLSAEEQKILWKKYRSGDENGRRLLLQLNYPLVRAIVARFAFDKNAAEDLFQGGIVGLLDAMERFDPGRGVAFGTYAFPFIKGEVLRSLAELKGETKRVQLEKWREMARCEGSAKDAAAMASVSLEQWMEVAETMAFADIGAEEMFAAVEDRLLVKNALERLTAEEKRLLYYRYGLKKVRRKRGKLFP